MNVRHIGLLRAHVIQQNVSSQTSDMADVGPSVLGTPAHGRPASSGSGGTPRRGGSNGAFNADGFSNASPRVEVSSGERRRSGRRGSAGGETAGEWFVGKPSTAILRDRALVRAAGDRIETSRVWLHANNLSAFMGVAVELVEGRSSDGLRTRRRSEPLGIIL